MSIPFDSMPSLARNVLKVTFGRRLPIEDIDIEHDSAGGLRVRFRIGDAPFMTWLSTKQLQRLNYEGMSFAKEALGPFNELRRMVDEAEERGREQERKSTLAALERRTSALGRALDVIDRLRRLRRAARRARRSA